jgi:hypothetical protein
LPSPLQISCLPAVWPKAQELLGHYGQYRKIRHHSAAMTPFICLESGNLRKITLVIP